MVGVLQKNSTIFYPPLLLHVADDCMIDEDNWAFTQTLNDDLAEAMGTHVALVGDYDGPKVIVSDDIPWLKITCFIDNGLTKVSTAYRYQIYQL